MEQHQPPQRLVAADHGDSAEQWLMYRYLTGDLTDEEVADVELRLASDLSLQTALAESVSLTVGLSEQRRTPAVATANAPTVRQTRTHWSIALSVAAMLLVGLGLLVPTMSRNTSLRNSMEVAWEDEIDSEVTTADISSVVSLWSNLELDDFRTSPSAGERNRQHGDDREDADAEIDVPDWMLLAVLEDPSDDDLSAFDDEEQL